jgi:hypothetical protein
MKTANLPVSSGIRAFFELPSVEARSSGEESAGREKTSERGVRPCRQETTAHFGVSDKTELL